MFVSNVTPIILVIGVSQVNGSPMDSHTESILIQRCMFIAGIAWLIQIAGIWKIGSRLSIIMSISFIFLAAMMTTVGKDYNITKGAVIVGGYIEGVLGLTYKYWKGILSPIVSACVVCGICLSLFTVGTNSFGGGGTYLPDFSAPKYWIIDSITFITCLVWSYACKGPIKALSALVGLIVGYIVSIPFGMVDFSEMMARGEVAVPQPLPIGMPRELSAIISMTVIFLVSATETICDSAALCQGGLDRDITSEETSVSLACDGFASSIAGLCGCPTITSFSQNVGLLCYD